MDGLFFVGCLSYCVSMPTSQGLDCDWSGFAICGAKQKYPLASFLSNHANSAGSRFSKLATGPFAHNTTMPPQSLVLNVLARAVPRVEQVHPVLPLDRLPRGRDEPAEAARVVPGLPRADRERGRGGVRAGSWALVVVFFLLLFFSCSIFFFLVLSRVCRGALPRGAPCQNI